MQVPPDNRTTLRREPLRVPALRSPAELEIGTVEEPAVIGVRNGEKRAQLESIDDGATVLVDAVERQVKAGFKPSSDTVGPLGDAIEGLVGNDRPGKCRRPDALRREVVVPRQIGNAHISQAAVVDLNLVAL